MVEILIDEAKENGVTEISLDATEMGRPLYESLGFKASDSCMVMDLEGRILMKIIECGFVRSHSVPHFFTDNYDHPIYEDGVQLVDMIYLRRRL